MAEPRKTGTILPSILAPTTPREVNPPAAPVVVGDEEPGQGAEPSRDEAASPEARSPKLRRKRAGGASADKLEGRRLYLSEDVHFRLRMLAYQRGRKLSEVAQEVLDKALPKYDVNRVG